MRTIVVDIDGTISKVGDRLKYINKSPKDWDSFYNACNQDEPYHDIIDILRILYHNDIECLEFVFCTGRRESSRIDTENWIDKHLPFAQDYELLMRKDGDKRHDTEVKPELLNNALLSPYDVWFILEDRNSMAKKWRELGYRCLQVQDGDF